MVEMQSAVLGIIKEIVMMAHHIQQTLNEILIDINFKII